MIKQKRKVLVVDDDPTILQLLRKRLTNDGYEVIEAHNGTQGLAMARDEEPDCILLDILMPDINGKEVAKKLRKNEKTRDIPVIFMTVTIDVKKDKGDLTIEIDDDELRAFAKPLHNRKLLSVIRKSINRKIHNNT